MKTRFLSVLALAAAAALAGCSRDADVASRNLSVAADNFEVTRRVVFYNGINGEVMLTITGLCSLGNEDKNGRLSVTCKTGANTYRKHYLGLSDNVTFFVEHLEPSEASTAQYRVVFKPSTLVRNIDVR